MRQIPAELVTRIESGAATLCHVWLMTRTDGLRLGFTDHDRDLILDGVVCAAASGWTAGAREVRSDAVGAGAIAGGFDDDRLSEVDIERGLFDQAVVDLWKVDWRRPELRVRIGSARMARLRREGATFIADLEGPSAILDRVLGRTFSRDCDATLGDARCGVDVAAFPGAVCDRRWTTCVNHFSNGARFRGFPDIPGDDFLTATPTLSSRNDGGSRR
ncbi:DUF2163 domain-containing protein [Brevundimonas sp. FT23042]|uniref:DUF2163 domain-containing protein n=1 Tax=Brevundimonas sp. FT23042 TaxID=3393749 RepID=UPI003B588137